jgi:isoaspartyl peptidase/L-asparaginase-like protein (Ntn-hydrolase superfamily)
MDMNNRPRLVNNLIFSGILVLLVLFPLLNCSTVSNNDKNSTFGIVIHGGGGVRDRIEFEKNPELERAYRDKIKEALSAGFEILLKEGGSIDAVEAAGGAIAIDKNGNIAMSFTGEGMYRGFILDDGKAVVKIYKE